MHLEGDNMMSLKRANRSAALKLLHEQGSMSRKRMAECIHLTPAAITKIVGEMIGEGLLCEGITLPSGGGVGRREVLVELSPRAYCALGVLINIRQAILSAVWLDGGVAFSEELTLPERAGAEETVASLWQRLAELAGENGIPMEKVLGIGVAVRGLTDPEGRIARNTLGALDTADFPLRDAFHAVSGLPTVMANNVRALFAAQMFEARDKAAKSQFFLRCEYGIGASLSINNQIWFGGTGTCAEIGHVPVVRRGGKPCICGKSGCLETIASPAAIREDALAMLSPERTPVLWNLTRDRAPEDITIDDVLKAARAGDEAVAEVVDRAVSVLGGALKTVIYTVDPEKIVLYGRVFENGYYLSRLMTEMSEGMDSGHDGVVIEKSPFNQALETKAAGILMVEEFFNNGGMR